MTDYAYQDGYFGNKDSLATGSPQKLIIGADFEREFVNIESAVNSKLNKSSPVFSGTLTGPSITLSGLLTASQGVFNYNSATGSALNVTGALATSTFAGLVNITNSTANALKVSGTTTLAGLTCTSPVIFSSSSATAFQMTNATGGAVIAGPVTLSRPGASGFALNLSGAGGKLQATDATFLGRVTCANMNSTGQVDVANLVSAGTINTTGGNIQTVGVFIGLGEGESTFAGPLRALSISGGTF